MWCLSLNLAPCFRSTDGETRMWGRQALQNHPEETQKIIHTCKASTITLLSINIRIFKKQWRDKDEKARIAKEVLLKHSIKELQNKMAWRRPLGRPTSIGKDGPRISGWEGDGGNRPEHVSVLRDPGQEGITGQRPQWGVGTSLLHAREGVGTPTLSRWAEICFSTAK